MAGDDLRITPLRCGSITAPGDVFVSGWQGPIHLQVWSFVITHPAGTVLVDTGMHPSMGSAPEVRLGDVASMFEIACGPEDDVASQLTAAGVDPASITEVVSSHLHWDHVGGNALLPNARFVVQRHEWEHARHEQGGGYCRDDWDTGQELHFVDGEHDVFGDGRVLCVPTAGHTPGHQSVLVRLAHRDVLLTADACYVRQALERMALPTFAWDLDRQREVLRWFATLAAGGTVLVFGHDPDLSLEAQSLLGG